MQKKRNKNNAQSIFGVHQLPSTSQIGNLLDPIAPETLYPVLADVGDQLYQNVARKEGTYKNRLKVVDPLFIIDRKSKLP